MFKLTLQLQETGPRVEFRRHFVFDKNSVLVPPMVRGFINYNFRPMVDRMNRDCDSRPSGVKGFLFWWLESEKNNRRYILDLIIAAVIILSIVIIILDVSYGPARNTPAWVKQINAVCLVFFVVEYLCRFWVNTDFLADWQEESFRTALKRKLLWMVQPFALIDLIAIIPVGALRSLRIFRFFRIARLLRVLKLGRYSSGVMGFVEEIKNRSYELVALSVVVCAVILIGATAIFTVENPHMEDSLITNFGDAVWWATVTTTTVGYGDIYPNHFEGRLIASALMLSSIGIVGALGGIITSAMLERIRKMREGLIERITFQNHIVFCGWTSCAKKVAELLDQVDLLDRKRLVVINEGDVPEKDYLLALQGDFTRPAHLRTVNTGDADFVVIFYQTDKQTGHKEADRRSVLTALQAERFNRDDENPYTITEVRDRKSARLITGTKIRGDETLDKEDFDANLIINTMQYPGHTTSMFYNLSDFTDQWIQLKSVEKLFPGVEPPVDVGRIREKVLRDQREITLVGVLEEHRTEPVLNPPDGYRLTDSSLLYVVEKSPYSIEDNPEQRGIQTFNYELKKQPLLDMRRDVVFLGFSPCAQTVLEYLEQSRWIENEARVIVVSKRQPPEKPWIQHIATDYSDFDRIREDEWWNDKKLAIIFHETAPNRSDSARRQDIKNAVTSLLLPEQVRVIAEIIDEDYARVLQQDIEQDIELIYKERYDANLIANSIVNDGKVSEMFRELGNLTGNRLRTFDFSQLVPDRDRMSVLEFRKHLLDANRMTFLGMMKKGAFRPELNPDYDQTLEHGDILYCITKPEDGGKSDQHDADRDPLPTEKPESKG